ncbi:ECF transporter S component [Thermococcus sp. M39]|uniref:ECF transporter S component n=1 Tax=unclassified Thermococcus TaxID=2627626 RepID=UPI00143A44BD|nr:MULTISPECIES: ECF transporter S component [unclassified Thermococcus]NJE08079.1 ECF transporter S component [Thermococcus sp. M39]NJE11572.1 ECF transporter S component [Thermococcus sp. LS2]
MEFEAIGAYAKPILALAVLIYIVYIFVIKKEEFKKSQVVAISAVMTALVTVATIVIQVPTPPTRGYINLGDTMVMLSGVLFGPLVGAFAGGFGSALADAITGYAHWAPFTLIIKGLEGLAVGYIAYKREDFTGILIGTIVGGFIMVFGYFLVEVFFYGYPSAIVEVPGNTLQAVSGIIVGGGLGYIIKKRYSDIVSLIQT